jgi:hypothetical protein
MAIAEKRAVMARFPAFNDVFFRHHRRQTIICQCPITRRLSLPDAQDGATREKPCEISIGRQAVSANSPLESWSRLTSPVRTMMFR